jgi:hypothetical protein
MNSRNTIVRLDARDPDVVGKYQHGEQILILCDASVSGFSTVVPPADIAENTELVYQNTSPDGGGDVTLTLSRPTDAFDNNGETSIVLEPSQSVTLRCDMLGKWLSTGRDTHGASASAAGFCLSVFDSDEDVVAGNGKAAFVVPVVYDGYAVESAIAAVHTLGSTGATTVQIRRRRAGADVDLLATGISITTGYHAENGVLAADVALEAGDLLFVDVDAVHTTAPLGLYVTVGITR